MLTARQRKSRLSAGGGACICLILSARQFLNYRACVSRCNERYAEGERERERARKSSPRCFTLYKSIHINVQWLRKRSHREMVISRNFAARENDDKSEGLFSATDFNLARGASRRLFTSRDYRMLARVLDLISPACLALRH